MTKVLGRGLVRAMAGEDGSNEVVPAPSAEPGNLRWWQLETYGLTVAFWAALALFVIAFWVTPYLPLIDYHQHVAQAT
ncbi:hypothetical protein QT814_22530, partial [Xanthomonas citri pv. citri]